jgi:hypothetical protein
VKSISLAYRWPEEEGKAKRSRREGAEENRQLASAAISLKRK